MITKTHRTPDGRLLVTVCDQCLLGNIFTEGNAQLDLSSDFYYGKKLKKEDIILILQAAEFIHFIGRSSVNLGVELGLIDGTELKSVAGIPHIQVVIGN